MIVGCPLCGSGPGRPLAREGPWTVLQCRSCQLRITSPRPSVEQLALLYETNYFDSRSMGQGAAAGWQDRAKGILSRIPIQPLRALDIGAGEGHFVDALRSLGVTADGVEPSQAGRTAAWQTHSLQLYAELPVGKTYGLVTFVHSLEHLIDPVCSLRSAVRHLDLGGHVFIEVPNADSFEMWRPSERRKILDLPYHLFHFTPATLSRVVEGAGLRILAVYLTNPAWLEWLLAWRAKWSGRATFGGVVAAGRAAPPEARRRAQEGMALLRRISPGWKIQLVAAKTP